MVRQDARERNVGKVGKVKLLLREGSREERKIDRGKSCNQKREGERGGWGEVFKHKHEEGGGANESEGGGKAEGQKGGWVRGEDSNTKTRK